MKTTRRLSFIKLASVVLLLLLSWSLERSLAWGYVPVDNLVNQVDQLRQSGGIFDVATAANLIKSLQAIGTTIDAGDNLTARQLLTAFNEEVSSLSGVLMTTTAADQLIAGAVAIANSL